MKQPVDGFSEAHEEQLSPFVARAEPIDSGSETMEAWEAESPVQEGGEPEVGEEPKTEPWQKGEPEVEASGDAWRELEEQPATVDTEDESFEGVADEQSQVEERGEDEAATARVV